MTGGPGGGADRHRFAASSGAGAEPDHQVALGADGFAEETVGECVTRVAGRFGGGVEKITGRPRAGTTALQALLTM
jgi:hypothetical protein